MHALHSWSLATYDSVVTFAFAFVTFTPSCLALATMSILLRADTACAISAAYRRLCIRRRSTSRTLLTRNALWPDGVRWRVFLFDP